MWKQRFLSSTTFSCKHVGQNQVKNQCYGEEQT